MTIRRLLVVLACLLGLGACRLDVSVDVAMDADGTGQLAVVATVDADVVTQVPGLAGSLALDDATAAGWTVEGPTDTDDGGLRVILRHPFVSAAEATNLLNSLGPPFQGVVVERIATDDDVTTTLAGALTLANGFDGFGDDNLLAATGATPFRALLDQSQATPSESMSVQFTLSVPGAVEASTGDGVDGGVQWAAPLDGTSTDLASSIVLSPGGGGSGWAGPVATVALVLLVVWLIGGGWLAYKVWTAQARRRRRLTNR